MSSSRKYSRSEKLIPMIILAIFFTLVVATDSLDPCDITVDKYKADPNDCSVFYQCDYKGWVPKTCPSGLAFNTKENMFVCDWPENVEGCGTGSTGSPCSPNLCQNNGYCFTSGNTFNCQCQQGYSGVYCEIGSTGSPCSPNPCQNNGYCFTSGNTFNCQCQQGYSGVYCEIGPGTSQCSPNPCRNNGVCYVQGNSVSCQCPQGYTGTYCETETGVNPDCPRYPCPSDVSEYTYPDWTDSSCTRYYLCRRGNLSKVTCLGNTRFNVATLECMDPNSDTYVDCRANIFSK